MKDKPWVSGPRELLQHGLDHLVFQTAFDDRIAIISIDNAVELMMRVYLGLPERATGIHMPRAKYDEATKSFPSILYAMEEYAKDRIIDVGLDEIEWYHRLRNALYHEGNGITPERQKVEVYASIAKTLMHNLFGIPLEEIVPNKTDRDLSLGLVGQFFDYWTELDYAIRVLAHQHLEGGFRAGYESESVQQLCEVGILPPFFLETYNTLEDFRTRLSLGDKAASASEIASYVEKAHELFATTDMVRDQARPR